MLLVSVLAYTQLPSALTVRVMTMLRWQAG